MSRSARSAGYEQSSFGFVPEDDAAVAPARLGAVAASAPGGAVAASAPGGARRREAPEPGAGEPGAAVEAPESARRRREPDPARLAELVEGLNPPQREAVEHDSGPLAVIAGAGSGKTRVLTRRIARLVETGVAPWRILAITFTNKAAGEMRQRVAALVGEDVDKMWVSTFHSACVRILRREAERAGFKPGFTIYDDSDSRRLVEHVTDDLGVDAKRFPPRAVLAAISQAKSDLFDAAGYADRAYTIYERRIAEIYGEYERRLVTANAMDFDDLLSVTVRLLRDDTEVREHYQGRFLHVLVDEYQDTNHAQNEIVTLIGAKHRNVCVVGDTDQSIYAFRGAQMRNLIDFELAFPEARTVVLDQNYRSTQTILSAANAVINNNLVRQDKSLWSALGDGERIRRYRAGDEKGEATYVVNEIARLQREEGVGADEIAVFFRTNAQSLAIEHALRDRGIDYQVIGGPRFYDRREIRDLIAFLRLVANPTDEVSLRRVLNVPKRGIGATTVGKLATYGASSGRGFSGALRDAVAAGVSGKALAAIGDFLRLVDDLVALGRGGAAAPAELALDVLVRTGYRDALEAERELPGPARFEAEGRLENLDTLVNEAAQYADLPSFLEGTALVGATDAMGEGGKVSLMTLHAAKGLEFEAVFLTGMEEGIFPHDRTLAEPEELEEERRLCYVGITRARSRLYLTHTIVRSLFGSTKESLPSRFLREIPAELVEEIEDPFGLSTAASGLAAAAGSRWGSGGARAGRARRRWEDFDEEEQGDDADAPPGRIYGMGITARRSERRPSAGPGSRFGGTPERRRASPVHTTGAEDLGLQAGDRIVHARWGEGAIVSVNGAGDRAEALIRFPLNGEKRFLLSLTPLKRA
ncbi:MAG TPA: UvrD-helicase domain-containing protein [Acidimicrobiales bacterium]|nr:UvrD-helicase domain-containing protein [Acidimicrobiales bacterium]